MPVPPEQRLRFFVYIIESPSSPDLYHRRSEGELVAQAVRLHDIPCESRLTVDAAAFVAALQIGLPEAMKKHDGLLPILHVSAHGAPTGIQLTNGTEITWEELRNVLIPINKSLKECLLLCMSSCDGYSACQMAMRVEDGDHPFCAVVGNFGQPTWAETAVAYACFYRNWLVDAVSVSTLSC